MNTATPAGVLLEHLFRHQAGRVVAHLARVLGPARLDLAEESMQEAMLRAVQTWPYQGLPENPAAWLFRVAHHIAIDTLRRDRRLDRKADAIVAELTRSTGMAPGDPDFEEQLRDNELRMIFMCCHPEIPRDSRVALSLKIVGGFSVPEIARAFLVDGQAIAQRLVRAKRRIREQNLTLELPSAAELQRRLGSALETIYFIFNEGYTAHAGEDLIRQDLCFEALRLGALLASSSIATPDTHALLALMALQAARLPARTDEAGDLILLDDQDRGRWDQALIAIGFRHFDQSMSGDCLSQFHVQAAIAATHARASGLESVDWPVILRLYDRWFELSGASHVVALNRAVAVSKVYGPDEALAAIESLSASTELRDYYLLLAVRGHLLLELKRVEDAADCFRRALRLRCSEPERRFLSRKLSQCES